MAVTIFWSDEAKKTYSQNIEYLKTEWSVNELKKFILRTEYVVLNIETNPMLYSLSIKKKNIRRVVLNKQITLFYRHYPVKKMVVLLSFWNNYQDTNQLKY